MYITQTMQGLRGLGDIASDWESAKRGGVYAEAFLNAIVQMIRERALVTRTPVLDNPYSTTLQTAAGNYRVKTVSTWYTAYGSNLVDFRNTDSARFDTDPYIMEYTICKEGEIGTLTAFRVWAASNQWQGWNSVQGYEVKWNPTVALCGGQSGGGSTIPADTTPPPDAREIQPDDCPCDCYEIERTKNLYLSKTNPGNGVPVSIKRKRVVCDISDAPPKKMSYDCAAELARIREAMNRQ